MAQITEFDIATYNATKDLTGGPLITTVTREIPDIEPFTDEDGNITLGGQIGYYLAYAIMAGFLAYWFWM